jgi:large conductance mechanosensitive channel
LTLYARVNKLPSSRRPREAELREFLNDFRRFVMRGNLLQIAVAFIIGLYFKDVIDTFTNGIVLALVAAIFGKPNFQSVGFSVNGARIEVGLFLNAVINFVLVAFVLFLIIKGYELMMAKMRAQGEEQDTLTVGEELLTEIRDLLAAAQR